MGPDHPVAAESAGEPEREHRLTLIQSPANRGPEVLAIRIQATEPRWRVLACELRMLGERHEVVEVGASDGVPFAAALELLQAELADRLEHAEATARPPPEEAPLDESLDQVEGRVANRLGRLEVKTLGKDRQVGEKALLVWIEEVVAPLDRRPQRALPFRGVPWAPGQERQPLLEPSQQLLRGENPDARGARRAAGRSRRPTHRARPSRRWPGHAQ